MKTSIHVIICELFLIGFSLYLQLKLVNIFNPDIQK